MKKSGMIQGWKCCNRWWELRKDILNTPRNPSPLPPFCFQKLITYSRFIPGKPGEIILCRICMNPHTDIWGFLPTKRPVAASSLQRKINSWQALSTCTKIQIWLFAPYSFFNIFIDYAITVVPFPPLHSTPSYPPPPSHIPPYSSCPWVLHMSSLASTFPILFLPSPCLFSTYHLCYLFSVPFPPSPPPTPLMITLHVISISVVLFLF